MLISFTDLEGRGQPTLGFQVGDLISHRLYGYRGVVVAFDHFCMAGDKWYYANKTQPDKAQPWYRILVHDSGGLSTYVAQSNLTLDPKKEPIIHPRLESYFSGFEEGRYLVDHKLAKQQS